MATPGALHEVYLVAIPTAAPTPAISNGVDIAGFDLTGGHRTPPEGGPGYIESLLDSIVVPGDDFVDDLLAR